MITHYLQKGLNLSLSRQFSYVGEYVSPHILLSFGYLCNECAKTMHSRFRNRVRMQLLFPKKGFSSFVQHYVKSFSYFQLVLRGSWWPRCSFHNCFSQNLNAQPIVSVCIRVYFFSKTALKQPNLAKSTFLYFKVVNQYFFTPYLTNSCRFWWMISIFARIFLIKGVDSRLAGWTS